MTAGSDNLFPKLITVVQSSDPSAPANGDWKIYSKAGGVFARSSNSVVGPFVGSSIAATIPTISNNIVATSEGLTGNNSWVNLATAGPSVTATVGASGVVKITLTSRVLQTAAGAYCDMGFAASGANTISAGTANKLLRHVINADYLGDSIQSATFLLTGLTPGSTTFAAKFNQQGSGGTATWANREVIIECW